MRIVTMVNRNIGVKYLKELLKRRENIVGVVTHPEDLPVSTFPPDEYCVRKIAFENCLPVYQPKPENINGPKFIEVLKGLNPDLIISASFPVIFSKEILGIPRLGCVNTHRSFLPKYRGSWPDLWTIINGEHEAGVTIHYLNEGIDSGDIIAQKSVKVSPVDTGFTLGFEKFSRTALELFKETFPLIKEEKAPGIPQNDEEATYYSWQPKYAQINWTKSAVDIHNLVRALTYPHPAGGAFTFLAGEKLRVWRSKVVSQKRNCSHLQNDKVPGQVLGVTGQGLLVSTGEGLLLLTELEFEKDKEKNVFDYLEQITVAIILG